MYELFSDRAHKVMRLANFEAQRFSHDRIDIEHILLGLAAEGEGVAANVLKNADIDLRKLRMQVEKVTTGSTDTVVTSLLPVTEPYKAVVQLANKRVITPRHPTVTTEDILLAILEFSLTQKLAENNATKVLLNLGVTLESLRQDILHFIGETDNPDDTREFKLPTP